MRIYLDNCSFNRPFDDQTQLKIKLEAEAKLYIQSEILNGRFELVWSYILEYENSENPYEERKETIIREPFDYTKWQNELWKGKTVKEISEEAMKYREGKQV
ncbi:MAG: hypothetical protein M0021_05030 [Clostridia bacterium]|nr:hypothetical protein [Clostridia bacterium]